LKSMVTAHRGTLRKVRWSVEGPNEIGDDAKDEKESPEAKGPEKYRRKNGAG